MSWQRIRGHDAQRRSFAKTVESGRLAHAYLFTGPPGIGKRLFAAELAKAMLCENPGPGLEACDQCSSCRLMDAGTHPDFFAVSRPEDKNELPIETMRELCRALSLKPARGKGKIALLDNADDLNEESANCFLKTLEEPPPRSVFFLIGTSPERQLATIVSRCQVIRFAPLRKDDVAEILRQQEIPDLALLPRLLRLGRGSPGQALEMADADLWKFRRTFLQGLLQPRPDSVALAKTLLKFIEEAGKESAAQRRRASHVVRLLIEFFDDALALALHADRPIEDAEELGMLRKLVEKADPAKLMALLDRCLEADVQIVRYVQLVLLLEALMDAWAQPWLLPSRNDLAPFASKCYVATIKA